MKIRKTIIILASFIICAYICYYFRFQFADLYHKLIAEDEVSDTIDFDYWRKINPDVYAWVRIKNTKIDYPILQSSDTEDGFYLTHDIEREENIYGAIYTEKLNGKDFTDSNTILYGHNMKDGSMFGTLKDFREPSFFEGQKELIIFTPEEKRTYTIVAAYRYPAGHLPTYFDFSTEEGTHNYLQQIPQFVANTNGNIRAGTEIKAPFITLSTCTPDNQNMRYLLQAVLQKREKKQ